MNKLVKAVVASIALVFIFSSCEKELVIGEGPVIMQARNVNNFTGVSSGMPGKINFKVDPVVKVEIQAQQNVLDVLRTEVVGGVLQIDFRHNVRVRRSEDIIVNITAPSADYFNISGTGDIDVVGNLITNRLDLNTSGAANINVEKATVADKIDARISGSGNIKLLSGSAKQEELRISGSGSMDLANVPAEKAETHISGSGDMKVNLSQTLDAHISGSGSVYYKGNPTISTSISGSGRVRPI